MIERFYAPHLSDASPVSLEGAEAHHLLHVRRLRAGDLVELFDGTGGCARAEITLASKNSVELQIQERIEPAADSLPEIHLAAAVPKSDRFRWLVEKATELGVRRLLPIRTVRSVVDPGSGKLQKMRQTVISACKQSGRNDLMPIEPIAEWNQLIAAEFDGKNVILADPQGIPLPAAISTADSNRPSLLIVGPEGGLTPDEVEAATAAGAVSVGLGPLILRIETAALTVAAICLNSLKQPR